MFAKFFIKIEKVSTELHHEYGDFHTVKQVEELFETIGGNSKLKDLNISGSEFTFVNPDILARGINKLERVNISNTQLEIKQLEKIFHQTLVKTNLKVLDVSRIRNIPHMNDSQGIMEKVKNKVDVFVNEETPKVDTNDVPVYDDSTDSGDNGSDNADSSNDEFYHYNDDYDVSPIVAYAMQMRCGGVVVHCSLGDCSEDHSSEDHSSGDED